MHKLITSPKIPSHFQKKVLVLTEVFFCLSKSILSIHFQPWNNQQFCVDAPPGGMDVKSKRLELESTKCMEGGGLTTQDGAGWGPMVPHSEAPWKWCDSIFDPNKEPKQKGWNFESCHLSLGQVGLQLLKTIIYEAPFWTSWGLSSKRLLNHYWLYCLEMLRCDCILMSVFDSFCGVKGGLGYLDP